MSTNGTTIKVELDPALPLPERYIGSDEDGPQYGSMSLYDAIIEAAAQKLADKAMKDEGLREGYTTLVERTRSIRDEMIREAVAPTIADALTKPLRKTNQYGEPTGKETTLREMIGDEVRRQLANPADRYSSRSDTVLQAVIKQEVNRALADELKAALTAGKSEVLAAVRQQGTAVIEDALKRALPL